MANVQGEGSIKGLPQNKGEGTTIRRFIELLEAADLLPAVDLAAIKQQLPEAKRDQDAAEIARKLVTQNALTKHQAASLYQQRPKSLGLASYVFLDRLGTGGSGSVFKAKHRKTGDISAVKVLNLSGSRSPDALKRFQREAETAARLNHPNIVRALDSGESGGQYYTAMEYVEGTDLSTYIKKTGPLPWAQAAQCVVTAARALAYAHEQGIIHRDIKPANLMLCSNGTIKVLDMGLARLQDPAATGNDQAAEGLTQTGQVMGTVDYMAPEQALHTRLADARADVYGLGCTLYRLVTGDIPYDGDSMVAKILAHRDMPIPSMKAKNPKVPASADIVLQKMLAKKPEDRYQSMNELADELERCTQGYEIAPLTPPVNLPSAASAGHDSASHSTNSLTLATSTSMTGMPSGVTKKAEKPQPRRRTPAWVPIAVGIAAVAAIAGIGWVLNNDKLTASNEPGVEKAIPPTAPVPTPTAVIPTAVMPTPLPKSTTPAPIGVASGTSPGRPIVFVQSGTTTTGSVNSTASNLATNQTSTDDRGTASPPVAVASGASQSGLMGMQNATPPVDAAPATAPGYAGERAFAEWCFSQGFRVSLFVPSAPSFNQSVNSFNEVPPGEFAVTGVYLQGNRPINKAVIDKLATAPFLGGLYSYTTTLPVEPGTWQHLTQLPKLHVFTARNFNDGDAAVLRSLPELRFLDLANSQITDAALDVVGSLPKLAYLNLTGLKTITAAGVSKLARAPLLRRLNLNGTNLGDSAVAALSTLANVQSINLTNTPFTQDARQQLAAALPRCDVYSSTWYGFTVPRPTPDAIAAVNRAATPSAVPNGTAVASALGGMVGAVPQPIPGALPGATAAPAPVASFAPKKLAVPTDENLAPSLKLIREELFKDKYAAAKKPEDRVSLANELLGQAKDLGDDVNGMYAMWREARDLAVDGGDMSVAFSACGNAEQRFELDALEWLAEACEAAVKKTQARTVSRSMAEGLAFKVEDAAAVQKYDVADRLMTTALAASRKALDSALTKQLVDREKQLTVQKKQFDDVAAARKTVAEKADDPAANLVLGKYVCFVEGKWDEGLPHLTKGSDPILRGLAEKSVGKTSAEWIAAGDLWWTQGEKSPKTAQKEFLLGALYFYEKAVPDLSGLQKTRIDKRAADARIALGDAAPKPGGFAFGNPGAPLPGNLPPPPQPGGADATRAFVQWVFARNGYVHVRFPINSTIQPYSTRLIYRETDFATVTGNYTVAGATFDQARGAVISDADARYLSSLNWILELNLINQQISNSTVQALSTMPGLDVLNLSGCSRVTDLGIASLAKLVNMKRLTLNGTGLTDQGLQQLANLRMLQWLYLNNTRITDAGLAVIQNMPDLNTLFLDGTGITDNGLQFLRATRRIDRLSIVGTTRITGAGFNVFIGGGYGLFDGIYAGDSQLTDACAEGLSTLTSMDYFYAQNTKITDATIARLANNANSLTALNTIDVSGCRITDASVQYFAQFRNLSTLRVGRTQMTPAGIQNLQSRMPNLRITTN